MIPTFRGQALEAVAWFIPTVVFFNAGESGSFDRSYIRPLQPFSEEKLAELGLVVGGVQVGQRFEEAKKGLGVLVLMLNHLTSFATLPDGVAGLDDTGKAVLLRYLQELTSDLNTLVNNAFRSIDAAFDEVLGTPEANHFLVQAALIEPLKNKLSFIKDYLSKGTIQLAHCSDLSSSIQEFAGLWSMLRWLTIEGVIGDLEVSYQQEEQAVEGEVRGV